MRKTTLTALAAAAGMALVASQAQATVFSLSSYIVDPNNEDPGLVVQIGSLLDVTPPFDIDLGTDVDQTFDLFKIWTDESDVARREDNVAKDISVEFVFSAPVPNSGATVNGDTRGRRILGGIIQNGRVTWDGPAEFTWGQPGNLGLMTISLSNGTFNQGAFGLNEGEGGAYTVQATFHWDHDPLAAVPEPATWALMIGGFGLAGASLRRRRAIAA